MYDVRLVTTAPLPADDPDTPRLASALRAAGVEVDLADWHDATVDWSTARVTVLRSPWDYVDRLDEFLQWATHVATVSALWNPIALVRWNTHKSYLLDLMTRGAPVVPTVVLTRGGAAALDGIADAQGWNTVVVKPAVGVGARGAGRFAIGDEAGQRHLDELLAVGDVLVQPYAASVESVGELSIVLAEGRVTHGVRKRPAAGEYRIHEEYGGQLEASALTPGVIELAERVWSVLPAPALYARVDLLELSGGWHVLEVEVTEPRLFLEFGPADATEQLVKAVMARLG